MQQVSLEIMEFIEHHILPRYTAFGKSHGHMLLQPIMTLVCRDREPFIISPVARF